MRFRLAAIAILVLVSCSVSCAGWFSGKGKIKGSVVDADNSSVLISEARVETDGKDFSEKVKTDSYGEFEFKDVPGGTYDLSVRKPGYFPYDTQVKVSSGDTSKVQVLLKKQTSEGVYGLDPWVEKATNEFYQLMEDRGYENKRIAIAFALKNDSGTCTLSGLSLRFANRFNAIVGPHGNVIVTRDPNLVERLNKELLLQHQFRTDFDPKTVAQIGKKLGADMMVLGILLEERTVLSPLVSGISVEQQAYLPGLSINFKLQRGAVTCD